MPGLRSIPRIAASIPFLLLSALFAPGVEAANEYEVELTIDPVAGILRGLEKVVYRNETQTPLDTLILEAPGLPGTPAVPGNMRWKIISVIDVRGNNVALTWKPEEQAFAAALSPPLGGGFKTTFTIQYERPLSPADMAPGYLDLSDRGASTWYLKFRSYRAGGFGSDNFRDVTVGLSLPPGWLVASTGAPPPRSPAGDAGRITLQAKAVRNFALAISDRFRPVKGAAGSVPLTAYPVEGQEEWGRRALAETADAIGFYRGLLGGYAPGGVAIVPAPAAASSSNVLYVPAAAPEPAMREAIAFEAARLVWGWTVGERSEDVPFVGYGLSDWCRQNYLAKKNGVDLHAQYLASGVNDVYLSGVLRGYDTTLLRTPEDRAKLDWDFERIVARAKSSAVMHMLGNLVGEDKFLESVREFLKTRMQQVVTDRDFQAAVQAATPSKLDGFFEQWLRSKNSLDYYMSHVRAVKIEAGWEIHADVWKTGTAAMPVDVTVEDTQGAKVRSVFPADRTSGEMVIPIKSPLASIALDPRQVLPLISRIGARGRLDLAEVLIGEGKLLRAGEQIDAALADAPGDSRALLLRGRIKKELGDWTGALAVWAGIAGGNPDPAAAEARAWAQIWTARLLDLQGRRSEATALYTAIAGQPDFRGSLAAAKAGLEKPFEDGWPPLVP
jgi:hypothetical protein